MKAAVRCNALTLQKLRAQEAHGKRLDSTSQSRKVRNSAPIVGGGLDLVNRLEAHMEGTKQNKAARNVALHFIIKFPAEVLGDDAPSPFEGLSKRQRQEVMARQAADFVNETHGGRAVFAVRVDTDEQSEVVVDVFACPKYVKTTKKAETEWTSLTKYGKALAEKHQAEIKRRFRKDEDAPIITSPRAVGMSLQSEFAEFFHRVNGVKLVPKTEKNNPEPDRLETEAYKLKTIQEAAADAEARRTLAEIETEAARAQADAVKEEAASISAKSVALVAAAVALAEEVSAGTLRREAGKIVAKDASALTPGLPDLKPAIIAGADIGDIRRQAEQDAAAAKEARERAEADAVVAAAARQEAEGLSARLAGLLRRVAAWLKSPDLSASLRQSGEALLHEAGLSVPQQKRGGTGGLWRMTDLNREESPPEKPREDSAMDGPSL